MKKTLEQLDKEFKEWYDNAPDDIIDDEPRCQLTGEIIPKEIREGERIVTNSINLDR